MGASAMIAALLPLALLGAAQAQSAARPAPAAANAPTLPADSLVVFGREPVCHMGRTGADGTRVRFEYHPLNDSYHLLVSGPAITKFAPDALSMVVVRSGFDRHLFRGSMIAGTPDMPAALYVSLSFPQRIAGSDQNGWPRNMAIEQRLFDPRGLQLMIDDRSVAAFTGALSARAARELIKCSNRFAANGPSSASLRIAKLDSK